MKISIITVTYNNQRFIKAYFNSLKDQQIKDLEIIIMDNGSTDGTVGEMKKFRNLEIKGIKIIENDKNLGFAGGNNLGTQQASGEYLFFLNPDTKLEKNCLKNLWTEAENLKEQGDFILIPRQKNYESKNFLSDGTCVDIFSYPFKIFNAEKPFLTKSPFYADGASLFLPKKTFIKLGGFDNDLFMFGEDIDLSWKAHLLKIPLANVPGAVVYHYSGGSLIGGIHKDKVYKTTYLRRYLGERNALRNLLKNYSFLTLLWLLPFYLVINLAEMIVFTLTAQPRAALIYFKSWWWNLRKLNSTFKKRFWIQRRRQLVDKEILGKMYFGSGKLNAFLHIGRPHFS